MLIYESKTKYKVKKEIEDFVIDKPECVFELLKDEFDPVQEHLFIIAMDTENRVIEKKLFTGGTTVTSVDIKVLIMWLAEVNAVSFVMAHNHPAGNPSPSDEDIRLTKKVKDIMNLINITIFDHVVFSGQKFRSMQKEGLM